MAVETVPTTCGGGADGNQGGGQPKRQADSLTGSFVHPSTRHLVMGGPATPGWDAEEAVTRTSRSRKSWCSGRRTLGPPHTLTVPGLRWAQPCGGGLSHLVSAALPPNYSHGAEGVGSPGEPPHGGPATATPPPALFRALLTCPRALTASDPMRCPSPLTMWPSPPGGG